MTTTPMYIFRISPADPQLIEWRRNEPGAVWLYWSRQQTADAAVEVLAGIERAGLVVERQEVGT